ncbi:MAG TPA: lipid A biosynthesis acyltransferase [Alphaproteobacteria bacterium]
MNYLIEYALLRSFLGLFALLPTETASNAGGAIFRTIGPLMGISKVAKRNMQRAFPHWDDVQINTNLKNMWDHLGRIVAEYPHLEDIAKNRTTLEQDPNTSLDGAVIFAGGHIGNWEVMPPTLLYQAGIEMHAAYRAPNNPYVDKLVVQYRSARGRLKSFGKTRGGLAGILKLLQDGGRIGMLIDQKMNTGIEASFFGHPAMTSTAFVEMARKTGCALVPFRCIRLPGCRFIVQTFSALPIDGRTTEEVVAHMHSILESWINAHPEQWLWLHRRWKS